MAIILGHFPVCSTWSLYSQWCPKVQLFKSTVMRQHWKSHHRAAANYAKTIQLLEERFARPHKIISAHMEALLNQPSFKKFEVFLRPNYKPHQGTWDNKKKTETYGDILVPVFQKKLSTGIERNLARQNGSKERQLDNLCKATLNEIEILEAGQDSSCDYEFSGNLTKQLLLWLQFSRVQGRIHLFPI